jgi:hypothetical protein
MSRSIRVFAVLAAAATTASAASPTFYKDVLPILQEHCQECHRAGEIGPMQFFTFREVRPWAKSIREVVRTKKMPPWFANPNHGKFVNDRSLSAAEIETLAAWADTGAAEGVAADAPKPKRFTDGWNLPVPPDVVLGMKTPFQIPAKATIDYQYIVIPTGFTEDKWVQMVEARPGNRAVVHHAVVFVREPGQKWLRDEAVPYVPYAPGKDSKGQSRLSDIDGGGAEFLTIYTPGNLPDVMKPGQAKLIRAGSDLVFQMHYTTNGEAGTDLTQIGLVFAKEPPKERITTIAAGNSKFVIPPGDPAFRAPFRFVTPNEATILSFFPHMHVRGKGYEYKMQRPGDAAPVTLLQVDGYNFNWQLSYRLAEPLKVPAGTKFEFTGIFDNSPNNPANPDPKAEVRFGEQSWEEMSIGFFDVAVPLDVNRRTFFRKRQASAAASKTE